MNTATASRSGTGNGSSAGASGRTGRKELSGHAAAAIIDQGVVAITSLVLMVLVSHQLGPAALAVYAILINALALMTAVETAWVGDSLTVLDRFDLKLRRGLAASLIAFGTASLIIGGLLAIGVQTPGGALLFGMMVMLWVFEETGRRLYMARFEFWQLVLNDVIYAAGAFVGLVFLRQIFGAYSVTLVVGAMAIGCALSVLASFLQLPHYELTPAKPDRREFKILSRFAAWRSAQMAIRPASLYIVRIVVIVITTKVVLGNLEGARLFAQPAMTYVSGVASLLLPMYTEEERRKTRAVPLWLMTGLLVVPIVGYGGIVLHWKHFVALKLLGHHKGVVVSTFAIVGWMMVAIMFAAGQPVANLLIARKRARSIFWVRFADAMLGLVLAAVLVKTNPDLVPWALSAGMLLGTIGLAWLAVKSNPPKDAGPPGVGLPPRDPEPSLYMVSS
jgi:O-antigen/teichoic acid export membrane protein